MEGKQIILILRNLENAGFEKKHTVLRIVFSSDLFTHRLLCPSPGKALECICIALLGFDGRWLSVNVVISIRGTRLDQNEVQKKNQYIRDCYATAITIIALIPINNNKSVFFPFCFHAKKKNTVEKLPFLMC